MSAPSVLALDLSLTATGVAFPNGDTAIIAPRVTGCVRLEQLRTAVDGLVQVHQPDLVVVEGYAFGRANKAHAMGELGGVIRLLLHESAVAWCEVPPASVKKYATGKGNANKSEVLAAAIRRLDYQGADDNEADALWLRAMALDHLGAPVVAMPVAHRDGLAKVSWPVEGRAA